MRVLPILFNTDMVRAILDGRKTVTRRVVKWDKVDAVLSSPARMGNPDISDDKFIKCLCAAPCEPGDILYVRETWRPNDFPWMDEKYIYKADEHNADWNLHKWHPSIHMPNVTEIRLWPREVKEMWCASTMSRKEAWLKWLQQPAEEAAHG